MKGKFFSLMFVFCCLFMITSNVYSAGSSNSESGCSPGPTNLYETIVKNMGREQIIVIITDIKDTKTDTDDDGVIDFSWQPAEGLFDYYNVYVAVDPEDPFSPRAGEFELTTTTNQPFFCFLGKAGKTYVLQTQAVKESQWIVIVRRSIEFADYRLQFEILKNDSLITIDNAKRPVVKIFVDTIKNYGPRSKPSRPVICLKTGNPEKFMGYKRIP